MEMKHSLHLAQKQTLIMTPRLQQALKLLQVPTLELQQMLKQEVLQNPLLEDLLRGRLVLLGQRTNETPALESQAHALLADRVEFDTVTPTELNDYYACAE